jgi:hypothetical protein
MNVLKAVLVALGETVGLWGLLFILGTIASLGGTDALAIAFDLSSFFIPPLFFFYKLSARLA